MKLTVILLVALTLVSATPSIKYEKVPHIKKFQEGDELTVPLVEIAHDFEEIQVEIEETEKYADKIKLPIDTPKLHMGLHYIETPDEMKQMGVDTNNIDPDLVTDAFLLVVSRRVYFLLFLNLPLIPFCRFNSQSLFKDMDIQLKDTPYKRLTVIYWNCIEFHIVLKMVQAMNLKYQFFLCTGYSIHPALG